jgi:hypothetical protein
LQAKNQFQQAIYELMQQKQQVTQQLATVEKASDPALLEKLATLEATVKHIRKITEKTNY